VRLAAATGGALLTQAAGSIAVPAVVADLRHSLRGDLVQQRGDELGGGEDLEVALGAPRFSRGAKTSEQKIAESLDGDDEARLAFRLSGALAEPGGDCGVGGVVEFAEQGAVELEGVANQPRDGEHEVPVGHPGANLVGDEGAFDEGAALVAGGAEPALRGSKGVRF
jgi:hypothetical protein